MFYIRIIGFVGSIVILSFIVLIGLLVIEINYWFNIFFLSFYKNVLEIVEVDSEIYIN